MTYNHTTQVPNIIFDVHLSRLSEAELKLLLVVIRQTNGWIDKYTGSRKTRDRISSTQFQRKTGYGRRMITSAIKSLCDKELLVITDFKGNELGYASDRKGKSHLYYSFAHSAQCNEQTCAKVCATPAHGNAHNKTNYQKRNTTKGSDTPQSVSTLLQQRYYN